ncbi:hypothetical protein JMF97_04065 [Micromonospora fiedleri]|uniref:DUF4157 domain-containing protein n=1 Tax=Micromonospora fiedleri TaxID=1157498 RepID=A0ABS1UK89_9ACTN|nr:hypothetical protein [Micromonospora fiedleri]MBL6275335.1 hypothetical protein [Micromonospora fiedleri]
MSSEINVTYRVVRDLPAAQRANWSTLLAEFAAEVPDPDKVEVVITDEYEKVAGEYLVQEVDRANQSMTAEQYRADRADGARAAAKTCVLPGGRIVVVASSGLMPHGIRPARHMLLHEAQHVRLHQHGDAALAVHRRVPFTLPQREIMWEYLWLAESAIDEFRCERTVHERGWTDPANLVGPGDVSGVVATFRAARTAWDVTGDVMGAYHAAFASLDRMSKVLGYGAAGVVTGVISPAAWARVPVAGRILDVVEDLPGADVVLPREDLIAAAVEVAKRLRRILKEMGFDYFHTPGGGGYLKVL